MVELFGSSSGECYSWPVWRRKRVSDFAFDVAHILRSRHGETRWFSQFGKEEVRADRTKIESVSELPDAPEIGRITGTSFL